ncbi:MAG: glycoside hydrolase family 2 [Chloroflexi bacterium]|nr:glycoside hydrolase family 2 [Chloroflexota bacterium]
MDQQERWNADMTTSISLDGEWKLAHWAEGERAVSTPAELLASGCSFVPAQVPGNVELDLERAGQLPDPFFANNTKLLRPLEYHEWWYTRTFAAPRAPGGQPWELCFEGLDIYATIWVNDVQVGETENALVEHRFDVTRALRFGQENRLTVRLGSVMNRARQAHYDAVLSTSEHRQEALYTRKAPHVWGWDIMPRAVSAGIWRPVRLQQRPATDFTEIYYWTFDIRPDGATIGVHLQFHTDAAMLDGFSVRFHGACGDHTFDYEWPLEFSADHCRIPVPGARLWWPKGYGEPALYEVKAQLLHHGRVVAERTDHVGLRKVQVLRTETASGQEPVKPALETSGRCDIPLDPQSHFQFVVNDVPIMVKGTNWVPLDAFHSRDRERLAAALALVDDLGCNMVRCWGGNVYENDAFFDHCDAAGILVWQDFAFACSHYPQTADFLDLVRREAEVVVTRLRNHPALALWCGDNEIDDNYRQDALPPDYNRINREVLLRVVQRCDPQRHYVPSSPYLAPSIALLPNARQRAPEQHLWGPRGYCKSDFYAHNTAHFIGEIGYHGCPNVSSIRRFISPDKLWPWQDNSEWQTHAVYHWDHPAINRDRIDLMVSQVREFFGLVPQSLEELALTSQISQAEAKKFFIELARQRKWYTSGILWWNVLDGWPQFSDAVVDYYHGVKLAYHYIRRVQAPICVMFAEPGRDKFLPVFIANDTRREAEVSYRVWDADSGEEVLSGTAQVAPNQNWQVGRARCYAGEQRLYLITWEVDGQSYGNHYLSGYPPFSLPQYRDWLKLIATLPRPFAADQVAL